MENNNNIAWWFKANAGKTVMLTENARGIKTGRIVGYCSCGCWCGLLYSPEITGTDNLNSPSCITIVDGFDKNISVHLIPRIMMQLIPDNTKKIAELKAAEIKRLEDKLPFCYNKDQTEKIEARIEELELSSKYESFNPIDFSAELK